MAPRFQDLIQRRHDCIHNCDKPRVSPQPLPNGRSVLKVIQDVEFLVNRCDEHIHSEFCQFLQGIGCSVATITAGFQQFVARTVGTVKIERLGRHTLTLKVRTKAKAAVMDVRQIVLRPIKP